MGRHLHAQEAGVMHRATLQSPHLSSDFCLPAQEGQAWRDDYQRPGAVGEPRDGAEVYAVGNVQWQSEVLQGTSLMKSSE